MESIGSTPPNPASRYDDALSLRATYVSLVVSIVLLTVKFWAYSLTRSQAVFSDAMESIVNVVAAALAIVVVAIAYKPADKGHPYGHGKAEFFSTAFEGGLISFASILICAEAALAIFRGGVVRELGIGLGVTLGAGVVNAILGLYLVRVGRKHHSVAIESSGHHVLSDFWTSAGVAVGLILVALTGVQWIDPICALIVGSLLGVTGFRLVRRSISGLMDEEDRGILENLLRIIDRERPSGIIQIHHLRVMRSGRYHHIDAHAVVPEFWDVAEAHAQSDYFEKMLMREYPYNGELHLHVDPCRKAYCRVCDVEDCPIRQHPFESKRRLSIEEITNPEEPV